ncbi:G domain-containing protein [Mycena venus]|uniref:G domain-containing protein n=1 Tax=Mycena venus TaxID=2733690 RepID=A0A8H6X6Q9_9AGAR|nr:G domain-containing protein [Mycena venus]
MPPEGPQLVTKEILDACPRFRVLVVGRSGVGKSSLINYAFGIEKNSVSHQERGMCDINEEITSAQNPRFVLHDSMGFEPGQTKNFEAAKEFLRSRTGDSVALKDRVHVVWLCIQVPHAGGRVFETGDEVFLQLAFATKVPAIVVFTQFDKLITRMYPGLTAEEKKRPTEEINVLCAAKAHAEFQKLCVGPLLRMDSKLPYARSSGLAGKRNSKPDQQALALLIHITQRLMRDVATAAGDGQGVVPIVSAMAQRANAQVKIDGSIEVGMKRYWRGLASSTNFLGWKFEDCLSTIHEEITDSWNFNDPNELLNGPEFVKKIKILAQLVTPDNTEAKSWFENLDHIQALVGFGTTVVAATVGPAVAAIGLSILFTQWMAGAYNKTPETLRCFMGYIVDLTLVMDHLFLVVLLNPPRPLTEEDINEAVEKYKQSHMAKVHREIRQYVNKASFPDILQSNKAEEKVKTLIKEYCAQNEPELLTPT